VAALSAKEKLLIPSHDFVAVEPSIEFGTQCA